MSTNPILNNDPELFKVTTKDEQLKKVQIKTEKHDHENVLKSLRMNNEFFRKKYNSSNKKKVLLIITEILITGGSTVTSSTLSINNPSVGIVIPSSTALLTSIAILITNEYTLKLGRNYNNLRDWIKVITLLYEKTLKN